MQSIRRPSAFKNAVGFDRIFHHQSKVFTYDEWEEIFHKQTPIVNLN
jgi:hypothetical protein